MKKKRNLLDSLRPFDVLYVAEFKEGCSPGCCDNPLAATLQYDTSTDDWKNQKWICPNCYQRVEVIRDGVCLLKTYEDVISEFFFGGEKQNEK